MLSRLNETKSVSVFSVQESVFPEIESTTMFLFGASLSKIDIVCNQFYLSIVHSLGGFVEEF